MGIARCNVAHYREGEEHLCMVQNEKVCQTYQITAFYFVVMMDFWLFSIKLNMHTSWRWRGAAFSTESLETLGNFTSKWKPLTSHSTYCSLLQMIATRWGISFTRWRPSMCLKGLTRTQNTGKGSVEPVLVHSKKLWQERSHVILSEKLRSCFETRQILKLNITCAHSRYFFIFLAHHCQLAKLTFMLLFFLLRNGRKTTTSSLHDKYRCCELGSNFKPQPS